MMSARGALAGIGAHQRGVGIRPSTPNSDTCTGDPCPACRSDNTSCIDSRPTAQGRRRRRACGPCGHRWTTYEVAPGNALGALVAIGLVQEAIDKLIALKGELSSAKCGDR